MWEGQISQKKVKEWISIEENEWKWDEIGEWIIEEVKELVKKIPINVQ